MHSDSQKTIDRVRAGQKGSSTPRRMKRRPHLEAACPARDAGEKFPLVASLGTTGTIDWGWLQQNAKSSARPVDVAVGQGESEQGFVIAQRPGDKDAWTVVDDDRRSVATAFRDGGMLADPLGREHTRGHEPLSARGTQERCDLAPDSPSDHPDRQPGTRMARRDPAHPDPSRVAQTACTAVHHRPHPKGPRIRDVPFRGDEATRALLDLLGSRGLSTDEHSACVGRDRHTAGAAVNRSPRR